MSTFDVVSFFPSTDPFLIRKWAYAFYTFFDLNDNGIVEWTDFAAMIRVIGSVRGKKSDEYLTAKLCLTDVWGSLTDAMDKDLNDKISLVDWISMWSQSLTAIKQPTWQKSYTDCMFKLLDASGDQMVDLAEYVQVLGYFSIPRADAIYCFDQFAINSSGDLLNSIDYKRFLYLWRQYFQSTDTSDVGNYLLGNPYKILN